LRGQVTLLWHPGVSFHERCLHEHHGPRQSRRLRKFAGRAASQPTNASLPVFHSMPLAGHGKPIANNASKRF